MNRLLVIDGACLFNRFYSKAEPMVIRAEKDINKKNMLCRQMMKQKNGHYIEVLDGVVSQILRIQNHFLADYLVVVFDKNSQTTFRKLYYAGYKGKRPPKTEAFKDQILIFKDILDHIGIKTLWSDVYEADDLAGSVISQFKYNVDSTFFITADHDWLQLLDDDANVYGLYYQKDEATAESKRQALAPICGMNNLFANPTPPMKNQVAYNKKVTLVEEGIYPALIPDLKGLAGDTSDNIPGVKGIGDGTAQKLLRCFQSIESIYNAIDSMQDDEDLYELEKTLKMYDIPASVLKKLVAGRDYAFACKYLATIVTTIPLGIQLEDMKVRVSENSRNLKAAIDYFELPSCEGFLVRENEAMAY